MTTAEQVRLTPNPEIVRRFVSVVFDGLPGHLCCRLLAEKGAAPTRPRTYFESNGENVAQALFRHAEAAARSGCACFVVPGTTSRPGQARATDISATIVLLVDLDTGDVAAKRAHLTEHLGQPTLEVASGGVTDAGAGKLHLYWRLTKPATGDAIKEVMELRRLIAGKVGGDPSFARAHQPIRVAGSIHCKHGTQAPVEILAERSLNFGIEALAAAIHAMPTIAGMAEPAGRKRQRIRTEGQDGITRFDAMSSYIGARLREIRTGRVSRAQAWSAVRDYNRAVLEPPWAEEALRREFEALERVDLDNYPSSDGAGCEDSSEDELACRLADEHGASRKHAAAMGGWMRWTGTHWTIEGPKGVIELARDCCRRAAIRAAPQHRSRLLSNRTIQAVAKLASSDPRMSADDIDWDAAPMLLNTPSGTLDLETGELSASEPSAAMTRITATGPSGDCPLWRTFLQTFTAGDRELEAYLARVAGYCMTGSMSEQAFFFLHGAGANGKSVFIAALSDALGTYATTAPLETFMTSRNDRHPTELAGLRGARLVSVTETEPGRGWAESRIKAITGGDPLKVRLMHRDFFEFMPSFKLIIAGNHRPRLSSCGEAMRRRLHIIPCRATIPLQSRDKVLLQKLRAEQSGILGWALAGCVDWQQIGLAPPRKVRDAADDYFDDEDLTGQWVADCCEIGSSKHATSQALFGSWSDWAQRAGLEVGSAREFGERLRERGFTSTRGSRSRGWAGLCLKDEASTAEGEDAA